MASIAARPQGLQTSVSLRAGRGAAQLRTARTVAPMRVAPMAATAGNANTSGIFAPIVIVTKKIMGEKPFNKLRGQGISLHSSAIRNFCTRIGTDKKKVQYLIRKAKKNGEELGFLA